MDCELEMVNGGHKVSLQLIENNIYFTIQIEERKIYKSELPIPSKHAKEFLLENILSPSATLQTNDSQPSNDSLLCDSVVYIENSETKFYAKLVQFCASTVIVIPDQKLSSVDNSENNNEIIVHEINGNDNSNKIVDNSQRISNKFYLEILLDAECKGNSTMEENSMQPDWSENFLEIYTSLNFSDGEINFKYWKSIENNPSLIDDYFQSLDSNTKFLLITDDIENFEQFFSQVNSNLQKIDLNIRQSIKKQIIHSRNEISENNPNQIIDVTRKENVEKIFQEIGVLSIPMELAKGAKSVQLGDLQIPLIHFPQKITISTFDDKEKKFEYVHKIEKVYSPSNCLFLAIDRQKN